MDVGSLKYRKCQEGRLIALVITIFSGGKSPLLGQISTIYINIRHAETLNKLVNTHAVTAMHVHM